MNARCATALAIGLAVVVDAAAAARADTTFNYYTPPKLKTQGKATTAIAGSGTVIVKVFVKKTGEATSFSVVRSSNHGNDAAALEIAKSATYLPATKGSTKQDAFYDYTLKFSSSGVAAADGGATGVGKYKLMISGGNYAAAQTGLKAYVADHPSDAEAQLQLGVADTYLNDPVAAAAAFDKAGTIPQNYAPVATRAYNDAATGAYKAKDFTSAIGYAKKGVALAPGPYSYNALGTAEDAAGQSDAAIADLEQARKLAATDTKISAAERAKLDGNLVSAYLDGGKPDQAKSVAAEAAKLDPSSNAQAFFAQYYVHQASAAVQQQKFADAAGLYEQAAAAAPQAQAPTLYATAALTLLKIKDATPNDKAKADADKALAIDPDNAEANFAAGIALANQPGKSKDALVYLNKADASAKKGTDADLTAAVENAIKQVGGAK